MQVPLLPIPRSPSPSPLAMSSIATGRASPPPSTMRHKSHTTPTRTAIPWPVFIPIISFRVIDAMFYAAMFPIITDMITSFNVPQNRIGFYAGFGEGVLMLTEAVVATTWAKLADRWGRRPCMLWGQIPPLLASIMIGFSTKVWHVVLWRAILGLSPCGVLNKIMASEISNVSNRSRIFSIFSPSFSAGMLIGTFLAGQLAHPYGRLPSWLGGTSEFWRAWPYALPNVVIAAVGAVGCIYGYYTVVETRSPVNEKHDIASPIAEKRQRTGSMTDTMKVPGFLLITIIFCSFQITNFAYDGIFTVYTYTEVAHGGLGLPVDTIGLLYSYGAALYIIIVPTLLPPLQNRFGAKKLLEAVFGLWIIVTLLIPLSQWTALHMRWMMWLTVILSSTLKCFAAFAWPMCDILTMNTLQDYPHLLATGSAISLIGGSFGRAIGPTLSGWIYSMSTQFEAGTLGRQISWISMLAFAVPPMICVIFFKEQSEKSGYEAVPMDEAEYERDSSDIEDRDGSQRAKVSGTDV